MKPWDHRSRTDRSAVRRRHVVNQEAPARFALPSRRYGLECTFTDRNRPAPRSQRVTVDTGATTSSDSRPSQGLSVLTCESHALRSPPLGDPAVACLG